MRTTKAIILGLSILSTQAFALECGDSFYNQDVSMTQDLDCSDYTGFAAVQLSGNSKLDGNGYKIIAPDVSSVVYAEGDQVQVHHVKLEGSASSRGIQAYNVKKLIVSYTDSSNNRIGVDYYTEPDFDCERVLVYRSRLKNNDYGAKVYSPSCSKTPRIIQSDLSDSKVYAADIAGNNIYLSGLDRNKFDNSANGLNLKASNRATIFGLNLSNDNINGNQLNIHQSNEAYIYASKFGNSSAIAVDLYDVAKARVYGVSLKDSSIGLRAANDSVETDFKARYVYSSGNATAGLLLTSYGATKFSNIDTAGNSISDLLSVQNQ